MGKVYELGAYDLYPLVCMGESIEDSPTIGVILEEVVDGSRLYEALIKTLKLFPLFKTRIVFDKGYKLVDNCETVKIFNTDDKTKAFTWKKDTNGYPFKVSYYDKTILLRWCHAVTDGRGALKFFEVLLNNYYGVAVEVTPHLELGLDVFYDKSVKGYPQKKQVSGFKTKGIKIKKENKVVKCHVLKCKTSDIITLSKRSDASPATIVPPLFSMALRNSMEEKKNVKFSIVVDARVPLAHETMHNCIFAKEISYVDRFDDMEFEKVSTIYRAILDYALDRDNVIKTGTDTVSQLNLFVKSKSLLMSKLKGKVLSLALKNSIDATFTYLGKVNLGEVVNSHIKDFIVRSWTDMGYCNIAATDLNGTFTMNITEAYEDDRVVNEFIKLCDKLGVIVTQVDSFEYYKDE